MSATISLPFGLVKPDENTPVTTATEIYDEALGKSQAEVNLLIGQGGGASMTDIQAALDALKLALQGSDTTATLTAIKTIVSAIPTATYTDALNAIQQVVDALPKTTLTAADKTDILNAISAATPTVDFTEVLRAISASETAIKEAMPTIPTDYAKEAKQDWQYSSLNATLTAVHSNYSKEHEYDERLSALATKVGEFDENEDVAFYLKTIKNSMFKGVPTLATSGNTTIMPNQMYVWSSVASAITITKGAEKEGIVNEYMTRLTCGAGASVTFDGWTDLKWNGGEAPSWESDHTYEISIIDNVALFVDIE